ncbi:MAG: PTS sugar transporter subunit IIA [Deltaproteobacteria bacterium]|nr:PTS sugar transporter subunit IIA [Deltaproteobacteria bacterium]
MHLTVRDLTRLFQVPEKTVLGWIRSGSLPAQKVHEQYRFSRDAVIEWAHRHGHAVPADLVLADEPSEREPDVAETLPLACAMERGGVHENISGADTAEVLSALALLAPLPPGFSAAELAQLLMARETLCSTGIGDGVAVPHVRNPIVLPIAEPALSLCFLAHPLDFGAADGVPIHTFCLLLAPTIRDHLQLLSRLAFVLQHPGLIDWLRSRPPAAAVMERFRAVERTFAEREGMSP